MAELSFSTSPVMRWRRVQDSLCCLAECRQVQAALFSVGDTTPDAADWKGEKQTGALSVLLRPLSLVEVLLKFGFGPCTFLKVQINSQGAKKRLVESFSPTFLVEVECTMFKYGSLSTANELAHSFHLASG